MVRQARVTKNDLWVALGDSNATRKSNEKRRRGIKELFSQ